MRFRLQLRILAIFAILFAGYGPCRAITEIDNSQVQETLQSTLNKLSKLYSEGKPRDYFEKVTTVDYVVESGNGIIQGRSQVMGEMAKAKQGTHLQLSSIIKSCKVDNLTATTRVLSIFNTELVDKRGLIGIVGEKHKLREDIMSTIDWVKLGENWLMKRSLRTSSIRYIDGKEYKPQARPVTKKK